MIDHRARAENIAWLAATGESATGAARRLGLSLEALEKWCRGQGVTTDWHRLVANERGSGVGAHQGKVWVNIR